MAQGSLRYRFVMLFAVAAAALLGTWVALQITDRDMPVVIYTAEATSPIVPTGGELRVEYSLERRRSCDVIADRFIFDQHKVRFELPDLNIKAGLPVGRDHYIVPIRIPDEASAGPAIYRTMTVYVCNPLQRLWPIHGGVRDIPFQIR